MTRRDCCSGERGSALVEMAIVLPLLLILVFGLIDVGRLIYMKIDLHEAVQEGSLYGARHPEDYTIVQTRVAESLDDADIFPSDVIVECPSATETIRVVLSRDVVLITPLLDEVSITISASAEGDLLTDAACEPSP